MLEWLKFFKYMKYYKSLIASNQIIETIRWLKVQIVRNLLIVRASTKHSRMFGIDDPFIK